MESFTAITDIDAPAERVWAILADNSRDPEWRGDVSEMRSDPAGPVEVGAVTHEVIRIAGRTYRNTGRIDAVDHGVRLEWHTTDGAHAHGSRTVCALDDDRCQVTLELHVVPHGIDRLLAPLLRRTLHEGLQRDVAALGRLAATSSGTGVTRRGHGVADR